MIGTGKEEEARAVMELLNTQQEADGCADDVSGGTAQRSVDPWSENAADDMASPWQQLSAPSRVRPNRLIQVIIQVINECLGNEANAADGHWHRSVAASCRSRGDEHSLHGAA